jgi:mannose-6-phosphate isomerase-like protein (cupin superfamily)
MKRRQFLEKTLIASAIMPISIAPKKEDRPNKPVLVKTGTDRLNEKFGGGSKNHLKLSGKDTDGDMAIFEIFTTGKNGPALHVHHKQDEHVTILEGEYLFQVGTEKFKLNVGDTLFLPRGIPHTFLHLGEGTGRKISTYQPAGQIEEMFRAMGKLNKPVSALTIQQRNDMMKVNDQEIVGPGLKAE